MITPEEIQNQSYLQKVKAIAAEWVKNNPIPTVVAYGAHDRVQPFAASKRLEKAKKNMLTINIMYLNIQAMAYKMIMP